MHDNVRENGEQEPVPPLRRVPYAVKVITIGLAAAALVALIQLLDVQATFQATIDRVDALGFPGYIAFVALYIVACVLLVPGSALTLSAGAIYGFFEGLVLASISSTLGATAAFLVGRYVARDWVARRIARNPRFKRIDEAVAREGWKIIVLTRLSPVIPFNLLNYAYGVTSVRLPQYVLASWVGMLPGAIVVVYLGSLAGDLAALDTDAPSGTGSLIMQAVGLVATVAVTVYITRISQRALREQVGDGGDESSG